MYVPPNEKERIITMYKIVVFAASFIALLILLIYKPFSTQTPTYLYKVLSLENWEASKRQKKLQLDPGMDKEFIHLARKDQLQRIIEKFWKNQTTFIIAKVVTDKLNGTLKFEANPGGNNKYYHLYDGSIPHTAVVNMETVNR